MDIEYVDILTEKKLSSILVANMDLIHWSVRSTSSKGGDIVILARWNNHFNENLIKMKTLALTAMLWHTKENKFKEALFKLE